MMIASTKKINAQPKLYARISAPVVPPRIYKNMKTKRGNTQQNVVRDDDEYFLRRNKNTM